jgi:L-arginine---[L-arginyl-carrier protein] ligase
MPAEQVLPLSAPQTGIWMAQRFDPDSRLLTTGQFVELDGPIDIGLLRTAIGQVFAECDALRARIVEDAGEFRQVVGDQAEFDAPLVDLSREPDPVVAARAWMAADLGRPVDLGGRNLFSTAVLRLGPRSHYWYQRCHHVLVDAYGAVLFVQRTAAVYTALTSGEAVPRSPFGRLSTILGEEGDYLCSASFTRDREYWTTRFADRPEVVGLSDTLVAATDRIITTEFSLPWAPVRDLCAAAERQASAWTAVLAAAMAAYTHRITGVGDVVLGMPVTARRSPVQVRTPCMLAGVLPLRLAVSPVTTTTDLVRQSAREMSELLRHQRYNQADLRRDLGYADDGRRIYGPELNIMSFSPRLRFGVTDARLNFLSTGPVRDLSLSFYAPEADDIRVLVEATSRTYTPDDVRRHAERFARFVGTLAEHPDRPVSRADILYPAERRLVLVDWNATSAVETYEDVVARIRKIATATPHALAAADDNRRLDYATLVGRASALSRRLLEHGAVPGALYAVLTGRGVHVVAAVLGIWAAGGVYVPLDTAAPLDRTASLLADSKAAHVLVDPVHEPLARRLADHLGSALDIIVLDDATDRPDEICPLVDAGDNVAYAYFTSGSTGRPKGAMVHRHGMVNHLVAKIESLAMTAADSVVHNAPLTFDVSVWQMISPLMVGGWTRIVDDATCADPFALFEVMAAEGNTILEVVPSFMRAALDGWAAAGTSPPLPAFRWFIVNGEVLPPELCERWFARYPRVNIVNAYGATECSDDVSHAVLTKDSDLDVLRVPVGRPLRNLRLYVLDGGLRPVPIGTPGELYISGVGVGRGYLNDPVRTCAAFVPDPFQPGTGARMYRTGDVVRYLSDGQLDFLGRRDFQVKIRGLRIELGEVEAVLRTGPRVRDAVVVVRVGPAGQKVIVGYVAGTRDVASVRAHAASLLPDYAVPSFIVSLPELPLNQNGKVDRRALPEPEFTPEAGPRRPMTGAEERLAQIFAEVLGVPGAGPDDDFFALGGDSILSIQVVGSARRAGLDLSPKDVFLHRTPTALAHVVRQAATAPPDRPVSTDDADGTGLVPATPVMHWLRELGGPIDEFHQSLLLRVPGHLEHRELLAAVQALLDRHDMLRARLIRSPGDLVWALRVPPAGEVQAESCLRVVPAADPVVPAGDAGPDLLLAEFDRARSWLRAEEGRMLRLVWFAGGPGPGRLLIVAHHLVVDAVSWLLIVPDLELAWRAVREGREPVLPETSISFRGWSRRQTLAAADPELAATLSGWERALEPGTVAFAGRPLDPRSDTMATARSRTVRLDPTVTESLLTSVPEAFSATTEDILLTGLALALSEWGPGDVLIDIEGHGRQDPSGEADLSRTVGWFTTIAPVRIGLADLTVDPDNPELAVAALKRVKEVLRRLRGDAGAYGLLRYLNPVTSSVLRDRARPQAAFNYLGRLVTSADQDWAPLPESALLGQQGAGLPAGHVLDFVAVTLMEPAAGPQLRCTVTWVEGAVPEQAVLRSMDRWLNVMELLCKHVISTGAHGLTPSDVPLLTLSQEEIDEFECHFDLLICSAQSAP